MSTDIYKEQVKLWVNNCYDGKLDGISGKLTRQAREKYKTLENPVDTCAVKMRLMRPSECTVHLNGAPAKRLYIPQLDGVKCCGTKFSGTIACNETLLGDLLAIFRDIDHAGLMDRIVTYDGCYVYRKIRGGSILSMHARGAAIDINADLNPMGARPKRIGERGCVAELVPIFAQYGWYWGGNFTRCDGMHFEKGIIT